MPRKRPSPNDWTDPAGLLLLQHWAQDGLSIPQICAEMERVRGTKLTDRSLYRWCRAFPATIGAAISNGREVSVASVENALYKKAMSGDNAAMIFYLKNKAPERWSEHPELRGMSGKVVFIDDIPATQPPSEQPAEQQPADETQQPDNS